jgi:hypothetical protein
MVDKNINPLGLLEFTAYKDSESLQKFKPEIVANYMKFYDSFTQLYG